MKKQIISKTKKLVVNQEHELIDILNILEDSNESRIILTFTEPSDILISPINLKVILETADENSKAVIAQIVQNSTGVRNARDIGMTVTEATGTINEGLWEEAEKYMRDRKKKKEDLLLNLNIKIEEVKEIKEDDYQDESKVETTPINESLYKKIEGAIERSKKGLSANSEGKTITYGDTVLALDQDIDNLSERNSPVKKVSAKVSSLIGKDLKLFKQEPEIEDNLEFEKARNTKPLSQNNFREAGKKIAKIPTMLTAFFTKQNTRKLLLTVVLPLIMLTGASLWLFISFAPLVKVKLYIKSEQVSVEKTFSGQPGVNTYSFKDGTIPVKKETIQKDASGNTTATGKAYKGNKAEGIVTLTFFPESPDSNPVTIEAGTKLTTTDGFKFTTNSAVILFENKQYSNIAKPVAVTALEVGEEYNLPSGQYMTVAEYSEDEVVGQNNEAFSGGSKEEYTVLSRGDVDKLVSDLKKDSFKDANDELFLKEGDDWEIIQSTIKQELDGDIQTDIPIGAEADIVNVTISTKSTGIYYKKSELEEDLEDILEDAAINQNLFESKKDIDLKLDTNIKKNISVLSVKNEIVKVKLEASTSVKPEINKEEIITMLKNKSWEDGNDLLKDLTFTSKEADVKFFPDYFPTFLKTFPSRQGRILLSIVETD